MHILISTLELPSFSVLLSPGEGKWLWYCKQKSGTIAQVSVEFSQGPRSENYISTISALGAKQNLTGSNVNISEKEETILIDGYLVRSDG